MDHHSTEPDHTQALWPRVGPHEVLAGLASRLKQVREKDLRNLSQRDLQRQLAKMGVAVKSKSTVKRYETGDGIPRVDYVIALSLLSGVSPLWIMAEQGPRDWRALVSEQAYTAGAHEAMRPLFRVVTELIKRFGPPITSPSADVDAARQRMAEDLELLSGGRHPTKGEHPQEGSETAAGS